MGSESDRDTMQYSADILDQLKISYNMQVISAHRAPDKMRDFSIIAHDHYKIIIAGAGGSAHLPGMVSSYTDIPVIGVPISREPIMGIDSLASMVQMPSGSAVATMPIGKAGSINAAIYSASILAIHDDDLMRRLRVWKKEFKSLK